MFGFSNVSDAQEWARKMFKEYTHAFGKVPMGEIPEYRFEIENIYQEDIRIRSVTSSCGCTIATASKNVLKMLEKGEIVCRFNSPAVGPGFKQATITVRFDQPFVGECQLTVSGDIVTGITFSPDSIDFGQVTDSNFPIKTIRVSASGRPNFRIHDVKSNSTHIKVTEIKEVQRRNGLVSYELKAQLKEDVPKGFAQGELYVVVEENPGVRDRSNKRVFREKPISFQAKVVSPLQVAPEVWALGQVTPGKQVTQKVFLTSEQPFKITDVRCESEAFSVKADSESKKVHIVEVSYRGEDSPGSHECELSFYTDMNQGQSSGTMKAIVEIVEIDSDQ
ncbi:MAG: hypothetical protein ACI87E_003635 [Mariniblastus sp.]